MSELTDCLEKVQKLEQELDEMTVALSQAWDQLVPFLQEIPEPAQVTQDIQPMLQAISVAADCEIVGLYLFEDDRWFTYPEYVEPTQTLLEQLKSLDEDRVQTIDLQVGVQITVALTPIISENKRIGVLGVGSRDVNHAFTAVDFRILHRMADRFGSQVAVSHLAELREREALQAQQMQIANEIQQSVQPRAFPKNTEVGMASFWKPAREVGGDAWGWVEQDDNFLVWFVLDVAGKGLPAALAAVALHTAVSMALRMKLTPLEALEAVNEQFYDAYTRTDLMATVAILALDLSTGQLDIANAGHPPILVRQHGEWFQLVATAPPIGVLPDLLAETQTLTLDKKDLVITYSDGFSEIEQPDGELWGYEGLLNAIPSDVSDVRILTEAITTASINAGTTYDDQTLVSVVYNG